LDRVISLYTPTLRSFAREREKNLSDLHPQKTLLIGIMPKTPDQADLSFVENELQNIQNIIPRSLQPTIMGNPTKAETLLTLPEHHIVTARFQKMTSESSLLLKDWNINLYGTEAPISSAQFSYLSCNCTIHSSVR
jgi:hypothetical protein